MIDHELEDALRATLTTRAETVDAGPTWNGATNPGAAPRRVRWLAPLTAAAIVVAVVGVVVAVRNQPTTTTIATTSTVPPSPTATAPTGSPQLPIPAGMKAVDALGVELFVPVSMPVDAGSCSATSVDRPSAPPSREGQKCALVPSLTITIGVTPAYSVFGPCLAVVALGGETGCVQQDAPGLIPLFLLAVTWPEQHISISAIARSLAAKQQALDILRSAHAVPVDRNGCTATLPPPVPSREGTILTPLPATPDVLSLCRYTTEQRLAASARVTGVAAATLARLERALPAPVDPGCDRLTPGPELRVTASTAGKSVAVTLYVPGCGYPAFAAFTAALGSLAGMPVG